MRPRPRDCRRDRALDARGVAHVQRNDVRRSARAPRVSAAKRGQRIGAPRGDHHVGAVPREKRAKWRPRPLDAPVTSATGPAEGRAEHAEVPSPTEAFARARARRTSGSCRSRSSAAGRTRSVFGALKCAIRSRHHAIRSAAGDGLRRSDFKRHERARRLAPLRVGTRHHGGLHDLRMAIQALLHLERAHVLAARDDDVLAAVLDLDVVVGMPYGEVAGVVPVVANAARVAVSLRR